MTQLALLDEQARGRLAQESTDPDLLHQLATTDPDKFVLATVAANSHTRPDDLDMLADRGEQQIRRSVADNPSTTGATLRRLAKDDSIWIRSSVARHRNAPAGVLGRLSRLSNRRIQSAVASNPNTSTAVLVRMASSGYYQVVVGLAGNPNFPAEQLHILVGGHAEENVEVAVARRLDCPTELLTHLATRGPFVRMRVAENTAAPLDLLIELLRDPSESVRAAVCRNPRVPQHLRLLGSVG